MFRKSRKYVFALALAFIACNLAAQNEVLHVYGQLKDQDTKKKLEDCQVQVFKDGALFDTYNAEGSGKYDFKLALGATYDIKFSKAGYSTKVIRIDTRNIPAEDRAGGFESLLDGSLFVIPEGFNTDVLKEPMAKASFDSETNSIQFDMEYTEKRLDIVQGEIERVKDMAKDEEKKLAQFDQFVKEGDAKMGEQKYSDAVGRYSEALKVFPGKEPAKSKLEEARKKEAEANLGKEAEANYKKHMADGEAAFKKQNWKDARTHYTEAGKIKPKEQQPKDMLAKIDEAEKSAGKKADYDKAVADADNKFKSRDYTGAISRYNDALAMFPTESYPRNQILKAEQAMAGEKDAVKRAKYDGIIADADAKFSNKDYAVSIEKYREALVLYPDEDYPQDQVLKAQRALDGMLSDEAAKQKREQEYKAKLALGEKNLSEDKLDLALRAYKDASSIKPEEQLPKQKIQEIEQLIADSKKKKADQANAVAAVDSEKERIEREYNAHIVKADELFSQEKLRDARTEYEAALTIKEAQYPQQRIQRINLLLEEEDERLAREKQKADAEKERRAKTESLTQAGQDKAALQKQAQEDHQRRAADLENQRIAEAQKLIDNKKEPTWESDADADAEIAVEEYYRDALRKEEAARYAKIQDIIARQDSGEFSNSAEQDERIARNEQDITSKLEKKTDIDEKGAELNERNISATDEKKEKNLDDTRGYQQRSEIKQDATVSQLADKRDKLESLADNDRYREDRVDDMDDKKTRVAENTEAYIQRGNARVTDNNIKVEETMEEQRHMTYAGEETRLENQHKLEDKINEYNTKNQDLKTASDEKLISTKERIDSRQQKYLTIGEGKTQASDNAEAIAQKKEKMELETMQREIDSANKRHENRNQQLSKKNGDPKNVDEYPAAPGTEELLEGVTENSYELGNKKVTERKVKIGNRVESYKKVVSKTGIYYFKNGRSITETIWKQETLKSSL